MLETCAVAGQWRAAFAECDGLEMTMEPKTLREGGNNQAQIHLVGPVSYGHLTLKRGMTANLDLWKWFALSTGNENRSLRASGVVLMSDAAQRPCLSYTLVDCLPLKIKSPALILHPRDDDLADIDNAFYLQKNLGGRVEMVVLEDSYHIITLDKQRQVVVERSVAFADGIARANADQLVPAAAIPRAEVTAAE